MVWESWEVMIASISGRQLTKRHACMKTASTSAWHKINEFSHEEQDSTYEPTLLPELSWCLLNEDRLGALTPILEDLSTLITWDFNCAGSWFTTLLELYWHCDNHHKYLAEGAHIDLIFCSPYSGFRNVLQTTRATSLFAISSHIEPQTPLKQISTLPT